MKEKIKGLLIKYKEFVLYALFGVLTTIANAGAFLLMSEILGEEYAAVNNTVAWFVGVAVAFVTNKIWVFESKSKKVLTVVKEALEFTLARLLSYVFETVGLVVAIDLFSCDTKWGQLGIKLVLSIVVVIMNYVSSKLIIFRKKNKKKEDK
ncbi:MAG: GtrA family protein [Ruminococcaceae bacterium]|nr:GtrA family protein [Oscillospiraceae bacterium]